MPTSSSPFSDDGSRRLQEVGRVQAHVRGKSKGYDKGQIVEGSREVNSVTSHEQYFRLQAASFENFFSCLSQQPDSPAEEL
jgi:hypothetical protein